MTDLALVRSRLATELARRIGPTLPPDTWTEAEIRSWIEREFWWVFDDVDKGNIELESALVFATDRVLQELNEPLRAVTGAPWPPSRAVPWPESQRAGVDTNRTPWAEQRGDAIHLGYGHGETAALSFEPIPFDELRD